MLERSGCFGETVRARRTVALKSAKARQKSYTQTVTIMITMIMKQSVPMAINSWVNLWFQVNFLNNVFDFDSDVQSTT